jgi:uncharacterized membrane protein YkvA (DUF1232 family)
LLIALGAYLALLFDLVPDFIPVAGQLDDAIIVALVLRHFIRAGGEPMMRELWPGPERSLALILRLARPGGSLAEATRAALDGNAAPLHLAEHALLSPGRAAGHSTNRLLYVLSL